MVFGLSCPLCQVPHLILAASLILSAIKAFRFHAHAKVLFHAMSGLLLLVYPQLIYGPMISGGKFDAVHVVLQRFTAPYHFLACSLILDGIWLLVELYALIYSSRSSLSDEIELMCARTRRWIDTGHSNFGSQRAVFWIDSAICLFSAMFQFAFAEQLLKLMIIREHIITELHEMYAREFACQCLAPAIISLVASFQFSTGQQKHYIGQRILSQALVCILSGWAHFGVGLFAPAHTVPFAEALEDVIGAGGIVPPDWPTSSAAATPPPRPLMCSVQPLYRK
ncbi:hypothetical protein GPALN_011592 [Globodera pallida]|nr:hypothetical protein GPALN_011592 [Globodera pallida]